MKIKEAIIVLLFATTLFLVFKPKPQQAASDDKIIKQYRIPKVTQEQMESNPLVEDAYVSLTAYITAYNAGESQDFLDELCEDIKKEYEMQVVVLGSGVLSVQDLQGKEILSANV